MQKYFTTYRLSGSITNAKNGHFTRDTNIFFVAFLDSLYDITMYFENNVNTVYCDTVSYFNNPGKDFLKYQILRKKYQNLGITDS